MISNNENTIIIEYESEIDLEENFKKYVWLSDQKGMINTIINTVERNNPGFVSLNFDVIIQKINNKKYLITGLNFYNKGREKEILVTNNEIKEILNLEFVLEQVPTFNTISIEYENENE